MATIREVVEALSRRTGVDAVVVVGRDGLPIDLRLRPHLERLGYRVSLARTLAEARAALEDRHAPLDAMLLDLHLPDGSGLDLLRELRAAAATRRLPVIVLTAEGDERVLGEVEELGAALLTKPFSPSKLTARIAAMLDDGPPPARADPR